MIYVTDYIYSSKQTDASPRSILVFSGRYHIISTASIVNNCIILHGRVCIMKALIRLCGAAYPRNCSSRMYKADFIVMRFKLYARLRLKFSTNLSLIFRKKMNYYDIMRKSTFCICGIRTSYRPLFSLHTLPTMIRNFKPRPNSV